jgi:hypothetical protein
VSAVAKRLREAAEALALAADALEAQATETRAVYTREHLPAGFTSDESFALACRKLGLDPVIYKSGRSWRVPAEVWEQARREDRARRRGPTATPPIDPIDATLERAGLRLVRGPR